MIILTGIVGGLCAVVTALRLYTRRLDEEAQKFIVEIRHDLEEMAVDCVDCFFHTLVLYVAMTIFGVATTVALPAAMSVGAIKLFSSDNVHPTNYMHRTRKRLCRWWWCNHEDPK